MLSATGTTDNPYRYVGALGIQIGAGTLFLYLGTLCYDPALGRFTGQATFSTDGAHEDPHWPVAALNALAQEAHAIGWQGVSGVLLSKGKKKCSPKTCKDLRKDMKGLANNLEEHARLRRLHAKPCNNTKAKLLDYADRCLSGNDEKRGREFCQLARALQKCTGVKGFSEEGLQEYWDLCGN